MITIFTGTVIQTTLFRGYRNKKIKDSEFKIGEKVFFATDFLPDIWILYG